MCLNKTHVLATYDTTGTFVSMEVTSSTVRETRSDGLMKFRALSPKIIRCSHDLLTNSRAHSNSKPGRLVKVHDRKVGNLEISDDSLTRFFNPKLNLTFLGYNPDLPPYCVSVPSIQQLLRAAKQSTSKKPCG
jgi:hypothetical protein